MKVDGMCTCTLSRRVTMAEYDVVCAAIAMYFCLSFVEFENGPVRSTIVAIYSSSYPRIFNCVGNHHETKYS